MAEGAFWDASPRAVQVATRWQVERDKFDRQRADQRAGVIAAEIANANERIKKAGGGVFEARDFFPELPEAEREPMAPETMKAILAGISGPKLE